MPSPLKLLFLAAASIGQFCTDSTKKEYTESLKKQNCQDTSIIASNKPSDMQVGIKNNVVVPISCLSNQTKCNLDGKKWDNYIVTMTEKIETIIEASREQATKKIHAWQVAEIGPALKKLTHSLTPHQLKVALTLLRQLFEIKNRYADRQIVMDHNAGNCGEQSAKSAINLLQQAQKNGLDLRIHSVTLRSSTMGPPISEHTFLLLDSDTRPVEISRNRAATRRYLETLTGDICDSWSNGLFAPLRDNTNGLYDYRTSWDSVEVRQIHFDFEKLKTLPTALQQLFCDELAKMDLSQEPKKICDTRPSFKN